ncbi:MAG: hypothetical protein WCI97_11325 [Bacteroidota bacterium]
MKTFIRPFIFIVLLINAIGFIWGIDPQAFGFYIAMFFLPINFIFIVFGVVKVVLLQRKKTEINYPMYYGIVVLIPVTAQLILFLMIDLFARKGGC